ncbi:MAG: acylphosphatase [Xanthomonadaceae bacterium]|nr:acylphosphatase [Xanthomonadaceae bacterium]
MSECRKFWIYGKVQGVFFRDATRQQAERLGLTGHALNLDDGRVEVLACGEVGALDTLGQWLEFGPPQARVQNVETQTAEGPPPAHFTTG